MKSCAGRLRAVAVAKGPSQHEGKSGNEKFEMREAPLERTGLGYRPDCSWSNVRAAEVCPSSANRHWLLRRTTHPSAPVSPKISFAFLVQSELSEYRKEGCPARRCRDNCLRLFRCWRWACRRRHTGVSVSACCVLQETHVAMAVVAVEAWRPSAAHEMVLADTL